MFQNTSVFYGCIAAVGVSVFILVFQATLIFQRIQESYQSGSGVGNGMETDMARQGGGGLLPEDVLRIKMIIAIFLGGIAMTMLGSQFSKLAQFGAVIVLLAALILVIVFFVSFTVPDKIINMLNERRIEKMNRQLADAMNILSLSLRSGKTFEASMPVAAKEIPSPLAEEFNRVVQEINVAGVPLKSAMNRLAERVTFKDMRIFVSTVLIVLSIGGQQADILDRSSELIRQRFQIKMKCKALTAEGRFTALSISCAPAVILAVNLVINYDMTHKFVTNPIGMLILVGIGISDYIGYRILMRIVKSDL